MKERIDEDGDEKRPRDSYANESEGSGTEAEEGDEVVAQADVILTDAVETESADGEGDTLDEGDGEDDDEAVTAPTKRRRQRSSADTEEEEEG